MDAPSKTWVRFKSEAAGPEAVATGLCKGSTASVIMLVWLWWRGAKMPAVSGDGVKLDVPLWLCYSFIQ